MYKIKIQEINKVSKYKQIVTAIVDDIETGILATNEWLPSINHFSEHNNVARDTVEKAYKDLRKRGYIASYPGRGFLIIERNAKQKKVLLIFNKLSSFKKIIYDSLLESLGDKAKVDLQIHHYNPRILQEILAENMGKYDFYVIMPHFFSKAVVKDYTEIIKMVPAHQLILLDKDLPGLAFPYRAVYQDFKNDIFQALHSMSSQCKNYKSITLVLPEDINHPKEIKAGIKAFCAEQKIKYKQIDNAGAEDLSDQGIYIVTDEDNLANIIKKVRKSGLVLGKDIGIISFNETVFKELLDITVITTDFKEMGKTAAKLILEKECIHYKNPFAVIQRGSL